MKIDLECINLFLFFFALATGGYISRELFAPPGARAAVVVVSALLALAAAIVAIVCFAG